MFNKKFVDKYPNVRKPLVCNGLKAITPYKKDDKLTMLDNNREEFEENDEENQTTN